MIYKLDKVDRKLLYELDFNARAPYSELAKKARISSEVARYRVQRLVKEGVIKEFTAIINIGKLNYFHYENYFKFQNLTKEKEIEIIEFLKTMNNVLWIASLRGHYDLVFSIIARNAVEFTHVMSKFLEEYGEFVYERNFQINIKIPHLTRAFLLPDKKPKLLEFGGQYQQKITIDKIDYDLINIIMNNARMNSITLAHNLHVSVDIVKYRLKKLEQNGVIQAYRALLDKSKIGYKLYQVLFHFNKISETIRNSFKEFCINLGHVIYIFESIGKYDMIVELEPESEEHLDRLLQEIKDKFSEYIVNYEPLEVKEEHQMDYFKIDKKDLNLK